MLDPLQSEIRSWLLNPSHPIALTAVLLVLVAAIVTQALAL